MGKIRRILRWNLHNLLFANTPKSFVSNQFLSVFNKRSTWPSIFFPDFNKRDRYLPVRGRARRKNRVFVYGCQVDNGTRYGVVRCEMVPRVFGVQTSSRNERSPTHGIALFSNLWITYERNANGRAHLRLLTARTTPSRPLSLFVLLNRDKSLPR